jgi:uncharacterized protein (TIGR03437 family)
MKATASENGGNISQVNFKANSQSVGSDTTSPYQILWSNMAAGTYTVTATAVDDRGMSATSAPITVKISKALKGVRNGKNSTNTINGALGQMEPSVLSDSGQNTQIRELTDELDQTYSDFLDEKAMFPAATMIDKYLFAASLLARSGAALSNQQTPGSGVNDRLKKVTSYLSFCEDLMVDGVISAPTLAEAARVNARTNLSIGLPEMSPVGSSALAVLPNQTAKISALGSAPFSTQTATANGGGSYELADVSVTIGGEAALILSVSPTELTIVVPQLVGGVTEVIANSREGFIHHGPGNVAGLNPTILGLTNDSSGRGVVVESFGSVYGSFGTMSSLITGLDGRTRLSILATGLSGGLANIDQSNDVWLSNGQILENLAESVSVQAQTSDGRIFNLPVEYAGAQGSLRGIDQVNVILVQELAGAGIVQLRITAGGITSSPKTISVN